MWDIFNKNFIFKTLYIYIYIYKKNMLEVVYKIYLIIL